MEVFNNLCQAIQKNLGSCFRPGVGRFASADTIVPDPANPQAYNRYSYVNNNPLVFLDPTGHCGAESSVWDANSQRYVDTTPDLTLDCIELRNQLEKQYSITITGAWLLSEMELFSKGLQAVVDAFSANGVVDSLGKFKEIFDGVNFHRSRRYSGNNAIQQGDKITIFNGTFNNTTINQFRKTTYSVRDPIDVIGTIAHELGHVWDYREGYSLSDGLQGEVGGKGGGCLRWFCWGSYQVDDQTPWITYNNAKTQPRNRREDFASTFAAFVVAPEALRSLNPLDDRRVNYMENLFQDLNN